MDNLEELLREKPRTSGFYAAARKPDSAAPTRVRKDSAQFIREQNSFPAQLGAAGAAGSVANNTDPMAAGAAQPTDLEEIQGATEAILDGFFDDDDDEDEDVSFVESVPNKKAKVNDQPNATTKQISSTSNAGQATVPSTPTGKEVTSAGVNGEVLTLRANLESAKRKHLELEEMVAAARSNTEDKQKIVELTKIVNDLKSRLQFTEGDRIFQSPQAQVYRRNSVTISKKNLVESLPNTNQRSVSKTHNPQTEHSKRARDFDPMNWNTPTSTGTRVFRKLLQSSVANYLPGHVDSRHGFVKICNEPQGDDIKESSSQSLRGAKAEGLNGSENEFVPHPIIASFLSVEGAANLTFTSMLSALLWDEDSENDSCYLLLPTVLEVLAESSIPDQQARRNHALHVLLILLKSSHSTRNWFLPGKKTNAEPPALIKRHEKHPLFTNSRIVCRTDSHPAPQTEPVSSTSTSLKGVKFPFGAEEAILLLVEIASESQNSTRNETSASTLLLTVQALTAIAEHADDQTFHLFQALFAEKVDLAIWIRSDNVCEVLDLLVATVRMPAARDVLQRPRMLSRLISWLKVRTGDEVSEVIEWKIQNSIVQLLSILFVYIVPTRHSIITDAVVAICGLVKQKLDILDFLSVPKIAEHPSFQIVQKSGLLLVALLCRATERSGFRWKEKIVELRGSIAIVPRLCYFFQCTAHSLVSELFKEEMNYLKEVVAKRDDEQSSMSQAFN